MTPRHLVGCLFAPASLLVLFLLASDPCAAESFGEKDLSLRLPAALSRFGTYGDVAGAGGASAGSMWSSSVNPASGAWRPVPGKLNLSLAPQYTGLHLENDSKIHVYSQAAVWDSGECGTFQPAFAQVRSNESNTKQGLGLRLDMDVVQILWGKRVNEDCAVGLGVNYTRSVLRTDFGTLDFMDSISDSYGIRLGALHRLAPQWLGGVVFDYAWSPSRTITYDIFGAGTGTVVTRDMTHQFLLRPGVSWEYKDESSIYVDYQYAAFFNDLGHLNANRFYLGVDHELIDGLYVRAGTAMDLKGHKAWTTGVGIYPCDMFGVDIAYQNDMFPELRTDFGRSETITISLSFTF
jgi:hypothetical protein